MKIDRFKLRRLSRFLIGLSAYVIVTTLASVAAVIILGSIMPAITELLELIRNSGSMSVIVLSSAQLVIITLAAIWLIIGYLLSIILIAHLSSTSKDRTAPSDTP